MSLGIGGVGGFGSGGGYGSDYGGIEQYGGLYSPSKVNSIPQVDVETVKKQDEEKEKSGGLDQLYSSTSKATTADDTTQKPSRIGNLEDISLTFNKNEDFSFLGQDSSMETLDMQKAISDMKKDTVLQEYQYFVGNSSAFNIFQSEDGMVIPK